MATAARVRETRLPPPPLPLATLIGRELRAGGSERPALRYGHAGFAKRGEDYFLVKPDCLRVPGDPSSVFSVFAVCSSFLPSRVSVIPPSDVLISLRSAAWTGSGRSSTATTASPPRSTARSICSSTSLARCRPTSAATTGCRPCRARSSRALSRPTSISSARVPACSPPPPPLPTKATTIY